MGEGGEEEGEGGRGGEGEGRRRRKLKYQTKVWKYKNTINKNAISGYHGPKCLRQVNDTSLEMAGAI